MNAPISSWSLVWRVPATYKVAFHLWLALHDCLLTNSLRFRCDLASSDLCSKCRVHPETTLHCLRDYVLAKRLQITVGFDKVDNFFTSNLIS